MINAIAVSLADLNSPPSRKARQGIGNGCEREDTSERGGRTSRNCYYSGGSLVQSPRWAAMTRTFISANQGHWHRTSIEKLLARFDVTISSANVPRPRR